MLLGELMVAVSTLGPATPVSFSPGKVASPATADLEVVPVMTASAAVITTL